MILLKTEKPSLGLRHRKTAMFVTIKKAGMG
jgi:hypothetical protein